MAAISASNRDDFLSELYASLASLGATTTARDDDTKNAWTNLHDYVTSINISIATAQQSVKTPTCCWLKYGSDVCVFIITNKTSSSSSLAAESEIRRGCSDVT